MGCLVDSEDGVLVRVYFPAIGLIFGVFCQFLGDWQGAGLVCLFRTGGAGRRRFLDGRGLVPFSGVFCYI